MLRKITFKNSERHWQCAWCYLFFHET